MQFLARFRVDGGRLGGGPRREKAAVLFELIDGALAVASEGDDEGHLRRDAGVEGWVKCGAAVAKSDAGTIAGKALEREGAALDVDRVMPGEVPTGEKLESLDGGIDEPARGAAFEWCFAQ